MVLDGAEKLVAAVGTAIAGVLAPIGVIYAASINRSNKVAEASVASLTIELDRVRDQVADLEADLAKAEAAVIAERASGLRWYQLAIWWFNMAQEMRRMVLDLRQIIRSQARLHGTEQPKWEADVLLPALEDPMPAPKMGQKSD
jgi:hypothetical protein